MTTTPSVFINNPVSGTQYWSSLWCGCVAAGGDSISVTIRFWSGLNGTGSNVFISTDQVWVWDYTTGSSVSTGTGGSEIGRTRTTSLATGGHIIQCSGKYTGSGVGSMQMFMDYGTSSAWIPQSISFSPSVGGPGTSVTISGGRFTDATSCDFNGTAASFSIVNDGTITATVPTGATVGPVHVGNPAGTGASAASFTPSTFRCDDGANWQTLNTLWADDGAAWQRCKVWADDGAAWQQIA